jgi:hypothetical protein
LKGGKQLKRYSFILFIVVALAVIAAGCGTKKEDLTLDKKHQPFPNYVLNAPVKVQETYVMASNNPKILAQVPCFCGCAADGHQSNLNCFVQQMGSNNAVTAWDQHGIS